MKPLTIKLDEKRYRVSLGALHHVVTCLEAEELGDIHEYFMLLSICQDLYKKLAGQPTKIKLKYYQVVALEKAIRLYPLAQDYGRLALLNDIQPHIHYREPTL